MHVHSIWIAIRIQMHSFENLCISRCRVTQSVDATCADTLPGSCGGMCAMPHAAARQRTARQPPWAQATGDRSAGTGRARSPAPLRLIRSNTPCRTPYWESTRRYRPARSRIFAPTLRKNTSSRSPCPVSSETRCSSTMPRRFMIPCVRDLRSKYSGSSAPMVSMTTR